MKLKLHRLLVSVFFQRNSSDVTLFAEVKGESGEVYRLSAPIMTKAPEESLRYLADQIASIRSQPPQPGYTVKSIMPRKRKAARPRRTEPSNSLRKS